MKTFENHALYLTVPPAFFVFLRRILVSERNVINYTSLCFKISALANPGLQWLPWLNETLYQSVFQQVTKSNSISSKWDFGQRLKATGAWSSSLCPWAVVLRSCGPLVSPDKSKSNNNNNNVLTIISITTIIYGAPAIHCVMCFPYIISYFYNTLWHR